MFGVRALRDEPLGRERLDDRAGGRLRARRAGAQRRPGGEGERAGGTELHEVAPRQPVLPAEAMLELLVAELEVLVLMHGHEAYLYQVDWDCVVNAASASACPPQS